MVISFHSLEDRIVKDALRDGAKAASIEVLTKKPLTATKKRSIAIQGRAAQRCGSRNENEFEFRLAVVGRRSKKFPGRRCLPFVLGRITSS